MKQALHILSKDARRLRAHIALVAALFAIYAFFSPETTLSGVTALLEWGGIPAALIVLASWTLGASVMHEDAPAQESPFWLTRPYSRASLAAAKVLFLFAFVFMPLLLAGIVLEARAGVGMLANFGSLLALCLLRSLWLIVPAVALGAITKGLMDFAALFCTILIVLSISQSHGVGSLLNSLVSPWQFPSNVAAILPMILAAIAVIGLQYALRRTRWNRGLLLAGVLASGLLAPIDSVALFSIRAMNPGFDPSPIHVTFDRNAPTEFARSAHGDWRKFCLGLPLKVIGLTEEMILRPSGATASLHYRGGGTETITDLQVEETGGRYREVFCPKGRGLLEQPERPTLQTTIRFDVVGLSPVAQIPARAGVFTAGDAGQCDIVEDVNTRLRCTLAEPTAGIITAGLDYPGYRNFARGFGDSGFLRLSPVLRRRFDGASTSAPGGWPFEDALKRADARFLLRNERVIGSVSQTLVYEGVKPPWMFPTPPPPPPPPPRRAKP